jgi:hypothetical protein
VLMFRTWYPYSIPRSVSSPNVFSALRTSGNSSRPMFRASWRISRALIRRSSSCDGTGRDQVALSVAAVALGERWSNSSRVIGSPFTMASVVPADAGGPFQRILVQR